MEYAVIKDLGINRMLEKCWKTLGYVRIHVVPLLTVLPCSISVYTTNRATIYLFDKTVLFNSYRAAECLGHILAA